MAGNFPLENQLPEQRAKRIGFQFIYQLPSDFWNKYYENLLMVSSERVQEVARQYFIQAASHCH